MYEYRQDIFQVFALESGGEDTAVREAAQGLQLLKQFDDATHHGITSTFRPVNWSQKLLLNKGQIS